MKNLPGQNETSICASSGTVKINPGMLTNVTMANGRIMLSPNLLVLGCKLENMEIDDVTNAPFDKPVLIGCEIDNTIFTSGLHKGLSSQITTEHCIFDC